MLHLVKSTNTAALNVFLAYFETGLNLCLHYYAVWYNCRNLQKVTVGVWTWGPLHYTSFWGWHHTLVPWPECPQEPGGYWVCSWFNFIRRESSLWQTKAQQMGMTGRIASIASKVWYEQQHQCCQMLGLSSLFLLYHWASHGEGWGFLVSPVLVSELNWAILGSKILGCWSCIPNEHTNIQWTIFSCYCISTVVLEQIWGQERNGQYCYIYLYCVWQVQKCVLPCECQEKTERMIIIFTSI